MMTKFSKINKFWLVRPESDATSISGIFLTLLSILIIIITLPFSLIMCIKIVQEYERAVTMRLGKLCKSCSKGPGVIFIIPCIDTYCKVDMRTISFNVPPQEVLTKDLVAIKVDAVVYYRIINSTESILNIEDCNSSTRLMAATTLRNVVGTKTLAQIVSDRVIISNKIHKNLEEFTRPWGVEVESVEMKDVKLPVSMQKSMATEAESSREAEAKIIISNAEYKASKYIKKAAEMMEGTSSAMQLKYLLSISNVAADTSSFVIFPFPIELMHYLTKKPLTSKSCSTIDLFPEGNNTEIIEKTCIHEFDKHHENFTRENNTTKIQKDQDKENSDNEQN